MCANFFSKEGIFSRCRPTEKHVISLMATISNRKSLEMSVNFTTEISIRLTLTLKSDNLEMIALN